MQLDHEGTNFTDGLIQAWEWWFVPIIPATWEANIGGWWFEASPGKKVNKTLS
jgi:hypothetical protein